MSTDTEQIRHDIERTREQLRYDVDALTDRVSPKRMVGRRMDRVREAAHSMRGKVMGTARQPVDAGGDAAPARAGSASSAAQSVADAAGATQQRVLTNAQGSPLAAGLIAFGVGVLVSTLIPVRRARRRMDVRRLDGRRRSRP
jgi:hypothetical protein